MYVYLGKVHEIVKQNLVLVEQQVGDDPQTDSVTHTHPREHVPIHALDLDSDRGLFVSVAS